MSTADRIFDGTAPMPLCQETSAAGRPREASEVAVYCVGLPVGVTILDDGDVRVELFAEDLAVALQKDEGAPASDLAAVNAFLDRGTALTATHHPTPSGPAVCPCGAPARLIITVEVIGSPNLTSRRPACRETCPSIPHQERS